MPKKTEYNQKHLSTSQRIHIEKGLNDGLSYAALYLYSYNASMVRLKCNSYSISNDI